MSQISFTPDMPDESLLPSMQSASSSTDEPRTDMPMFTPDMPPGYDSTTTQAMTRQTASMMPDVVASDMLLADRVGQPADLVSRNREYFRDMDLARQVDETLSAAPAVRNLYNNSPMTAGLVRDDLDNAVELERLFSDRQPEKPADPLSGLLGGAEAEMRETPYQLSALERLPVVAIEGIVSLAENGLNFASGLLNTYTPTAQDIEQYLPGEGQAAIDALKAGMADQPLAGGLERFLKDHRQRSQATALQPTGNVVQDFVEDVVRMGPQMGAQLAIYSAGGFIPAMMFMGTQIAGGQYAQLTEDQAQEKGRAFLASLVNAGMQAPLEALSAGKVLDIFKGTGLANVFKAGASAVFTEFVTEWVQAYPEAITSLWAEAEHKSRSGGDTMRYFADNFLEYTKQGMYEGLVASVYGGLGGAGKVGYEYSRYQAGKADGEFFAALDASAQGSKTRERLPQEYQRVVSAITEGGAVQNVYVTPQAMREAVGDDTAFYQLAENVGISREEIARAEELGGDIEISLPLYQAHIAGTETSLAMRDSVKFNPEDMTLAERMNFEREAPAQLSEAMKRIEADMAVNAELDAAISPIAKQLGTVYGKEATEANVSLLKARAKIAADWWTQAGESITPAQVVTDKWGLTLEIMGQQVQEAGAAMYQSAADITASPSPHGDKPSGSGGMSESTLYSEEQPVNTSPRGLIVLRGNELGLPEGANLKDHIRAAKAYHDQLKYESEHGKPVIQPQLTKPVRFSGKGFSKNKYGGANPEKWILFSRLREIIENSSLVRTAENTSKRKDGFIRFHWLETPVQFGGKARTVGLTLAEDADGNLFYNMNADVEEFKTQRSGSPNLPSQSMPGESEPLQQDAIAPVDTTLMENADNVNIRITESSSPRGQIQFSDAGATISLFRDSADLSTFSHEAAHLFINDMEQIVATGTAPQAVVNDLAALKSFTDEFSDPHTLKKFYDKEYRISRKSFASREFSDLSVDELDTMQYVASQEKIANAFLTYLQEGKAPTPELRSAFRRFKDWLKGLYQSMMGTVQINPEISAVFDRMLATDADMALAEELHSMDAANMQAVTVVAREMLTEAEQRRLDQLRTEASKESREKRLKKSLRSFFDSKLGLKEFQEQAKVEVSAKPVYQAMDAAMNAGGISRQSIIDAFGEDVAKDLSKKRVGLVRKEGGVDIEDLALSQGFENGESLVMSMREAPGKTREVAALTKQERTRRETELRTESGLNDGTPGEEDYYNDSRLRSLLLEMRALERKAAVVARPSATSGTAGISRQWARDILNAMPVKDAMSVGRHSAAEARAAAGSARALKEDRTEDAAAAKRRQAINHAMVLEALELQKKQRSLLRDLRRWSKSKNMNFKYQEQILGLAQRYVIGGKLGGAPRFAPIKPEERINLGKFMEAATENDIMGMPPYPEFILTETVPQNMSMGQLDDVWDVMRWLAEMGNPGEARMISEGVTGTVKDVAAEGAAILAASGNVAPVYEEGTVKRSAVDRWRAIFSSLNEFKDQMIKADGYKEIGKKGSHRMGFHSKWHQRINDAHNDLTRIFKDEVRPEQARIERIRDNFIRRFEKQYGKRVAEIKGVQTPEVMRSIGRSMWTAEHVWCLARNMGNAGNLKSITQGYDMGLEQLQAVTSTLSAEEWQAIQAEGDLLSRFYQRTDDVFRKVYGRPMPDKVQPQELTVNTADGKTLILPGWYFPLSVDSKLDPEIGDKKQADILQADPNFTAFGPSLSRSHTKGRTGTGKPAGLYFDVFERSLTDQLRFLTHAPVLRDFDRMTRNREWRKAYTEAFGHQEYEKIRPMLKYLARPQSENVGSLDGFLARQRQLASLFILGWNLKTVFRQFQGVLQSAPELGWGNILTGMSRTYRSPIAMVQAVDALSPFMADRRMGWDREAREATRNFKKLFKIRVGERTYTDSDVHEFTMTFVRTADTLAVYPIWQGAYDKGINQLGMSQKEAVTFADRIIQKTNASATPVDLTPLQREGGIWRLFTMFMGEPMRKGSRMRSWWGAYKTGNISIGEYAEHLFTETLLPAIYFTTIVGLLSDDEPDWKDYSAAALGEAMGVIPILSQLSGAIQYKKPITQSTVFTGVEAFISILRAGKTVFEDPNDSEAWARVYKSTIDVAAYSAGVGNVRRLYETAGEGWEDLQFGRTSNPFRLFFRKPKDAK